jgi:hypothetical protein
MVTPRRRGLYEGRYCQPVTVVHLTLKYYRLSVNTGSRWLACVLRTLIARNLHNLLHTMRQHQFIYRSTALLGLGRFFQFLNQYRVGRTFWTGDQFIEMPLPAYRTPQTQDKRIQKPTRSMGFETIISAFERGKTVHISDRAATLISTETICPFKWFYINSRT